MTDQEFKTQVFKTPAQWKSGLRYRLELSDQGGIIPYTTPTFVHWIQEIQEKKNPILTVGKCDRIYFIAQDCHLYCYDPKIHILELLSDRNDWGSEAKPLQRPDKILIDPSTLWALDKENGRVLAFSRENDYQLDVILDSTTNSNIKKPVDIASDRQGYLYILDEESKRIVKYWADGTGRSDNFDISEVTNPVGLAINKEHGIYVIDSEYSGIFKFTEQGEYAGSIGDFDAIFGKDVPPDKAFQPTIIVVDRKGNLYLGFVSGDKTAQIHRFDPDGSHIGEIPIPDFTGPILGLAADSEGNLYASSEQGIAFLQNQQRFIKKNAYYYSPTLDSGIQGCQWHRLALDLSIPPRTFVAVYHYASDQEMVKNEIDTILCNSEQSAQDKAQLIDEQLAWSDAEKNPQDMLFKGKNAGRYLWLKCVLGTYDEEARPAIQQMRVYYPRISYLRYLPAIYQEDSTSSEFLQRFLSIFETVSYGLETEISTIARYFDPDTTPSDFLEWLASWLNISLEEEWPEDKKRQFMKQALELYKLKGTPAGLQKLIEFYTGKSSLILEYSRMGKPMILGTRFGLGINSLLLDIDMEPEEPLETPFLLLAHRFTIVLDFSAEEWARYQKGLTRILQEEKPAHTAYDLRIVGEMRVGMDAYMGITTRVADLRPICLGANATVGTGTLVMGNA